MVAMLKADKVGVLRDVPLFAGLSGRELGEIARRVQEVEFAPREYLVHQGGTGREALVVLEGTATVRRNGRKVAELSTGDVVGEMSIVTDLPRNADVQAETFVAALSMSAAAFSEIIEENPKVAVKILKVVAARLAEAARAI